MNEESRDYIEEEDFFEAVTKFRKMIKSNTPKYFDVFEFEGIIDHFIEEGKFNLAQKAIDSGLRLHPSSLSIQIRKAQLLMHTGKYEECLDQISFVEKIEKNNPDIFLTKGAALTLLGDFARAVESYDIALEMNLDEKDETLYNIGVSFGQEGNTILAIEYLEKAFAENPQNEIVLYELGYYYDKNLQYEKSIEYYNKYLDIDPFNYSVWYNIGITYNRMAIFDKAIDAYEFALALNEGFLHAHFNKANALANNNQYDEAIDCYKSYLLLDENNDEAYCYLAECYLNNEQFADAIFNYQKAIEINIENAGAWYGSGLIMWSESRLIEAQAFIKKAIILEEDNADFWAMAAKIHSELNEIKQAVKAFEKAAKLDPGNIENWLAYSEMYFDLNDTDKAIKIIRTASIHNKSDAFLNYRLTAYLLEKNNELEAACHFENALKIDFNKQDELFDFYPEASTNESIKKLISQYQSTNH